MESAKTADLQLVYVLWNISLSFKYCHWTSEIYETLCNFVTVIKHALATEWLQTGAPQISPGCVFVKFAIAEKYVKRKRYNIEYAARKRYCLCLFVGLSFACLQIPRLTRRCTLAESEALCEIFLRPYRCFTSTTMSSLLDIANEILNKTERCTYEEDLTVLIDGDFRQQSAEMMETFYGTEWCSLNISGSSETLQIPTLPVGGKIDNSIDL